MRAYFATQGRHLFMMSLSAFLWLSIMYGSNAGILALKAANQHNQRGDANKTIVRIGSVNIMIEVIPATTSTDLLIHWTSSGDSYSQRLTMPTGWSVSDDAESYYMPRIFPLRDTKEIDFVVVATRNSGVYDVRSPLLIHLYDKRWHFLNASPRRQEFTDRGSFYFTRDALYVWDYKAEWGKYDHHEPQHYWLKTFLVQRNGITLKSTRYTRRIYAEVNDEYDPLPYHVPARLDPLREFGLKWRWWGQ